MCAAAAASSLQPALAAFAPWRGCSMQGLATQEGPIANWQAHVADPVHANVLTNAASGFGFY